MMDCNENLVFYFSGTGNSLAVSKDLAQTLKCSFVGITSELLANLPEVYTADRIVVVFPSYAYGLPRFVIRFLKRAKFDCNHLSLIVTCGSSSGGTLQSAKRILKRHHQRVNYFKELQMVENYIPIFGSPKPKYIEKRLSRHRQRFADMAIEIQEKQENTIRGLRPISVTIRHIFGVASPLIAKMMKVKKTCTLCGLCMKTCPANAITTNNKKKRAKIRAKMCNHCQACMNICPQHSIKLFRMRPKAKQYINPDIKTNELIRR